jgi:hypothetical protein
MQSAASRRLLLGALPCLFLLLLITAPAAAQQRARVRDACKADVERLCPDTRGSALRDCLQEKESELSPECREERRRAQQRIDDLNERCKDDLARFCPDLEPGQGRIARCLREHEAELSETCRGALPERRGPR